MLYESVTRLKVVSFPLEIGLGDNFAREKPLNRRSNLNGMLIQALLAVSLLIFRDSDIPASNSKFRVYLFMTSNLRRRRNGE